MRHTLRDLAPSIARSIGGLLLCLGLESCIVFSTPPYPSSWAPLHTNHDGCGHISGTYTDAGERVREGSWGGSVDSLSYLLARQKALSSVPRSDRVGIAFAGDGALTIEPRQGNRVQGSLQFSEKSGEFHCIDGALEIIRSELVTEQVVGTQSETLLVFKASDGSLVVKYATSGFGLIGGLVPAGGGASSWARFAPADSH